MKKSIFKNFLNMNGTLNDIIESKKEYRVASERAYKLYDKLRESLSGEQLADFDKFVEFEAEQSSIRLETALEFGIKYGVRFVSECMVD